MMNTTGTPPHRLSRRASRLALAAIVALLACLTLGAPAVAGATTMGDFEVTSASGGTPSNARYASGVLTITPGEALTVSMRSGVETTNNRIVFSGGTVDVTFDGVRISSSSSSSPVSVSAGATLNLTLAGESEISTSYTYDNGVYPGSDDGPAALLVPRGAALVIDGEGSIACSSARGAGIGGSGFALQEDRNAGSVTVNGGTVIASGGGWSAGIGGGHGGGDGGSFTINGGDVTATSSFGAGIGGGCFHGFLTSPDYGTAGSITIAGGTVYASSVSAPSLGAGAGGNGGADATVTISGGCLTAPSGVGDDMTLSVTGGYFNDPAYTPHTVCGIDLGEEWFVIPNTDPATKDNYNCKVVPSSSLNEKDFIVEGGNEGTDWTYENGILSVLTSTPVTVSMNPKGSTLDGSGRSSTNRIVIPTGVIANVSLESVGVVVGTSDFDEGPISVTAGASLNLTLYGSTYLQATSGTAAAVWVPERASLTIQEGEAGASLECHANEGAAIGGGGTGQTDINELNAAYPSINAGSITINSGTIIAQGGDHSAHIGGGHGGGDGGSITINGGTVSASQFSNRPHNGAALGGGGFHGTSIGEIPNSYGEAGTIVITGGYVNADGGIGPGGGGSYDSSKSSVTITGGHITASRSGSPAIGAPSNTRVIDVTITGGFFASGDVEAKSVYGMPVEEGYTVFSTESSKYPFAVSKIEPAAPTFTGPEYVEIAYDGEPVSWDELGIDVYYGSTKADPSTFTYRINTTSGLQESSTLPADIGWWAIFPWDIYVETPSCTIDGVTYAPTSHFFQLKIIPAELALDLEVPSKKYDGTAGASVNVWFGGVAPSETLIEGIDYTISDVEFPSAEPGKYEIPLTITLLGQAATNYRLPSGGTSETINATARIYGDKGLALSLTPDQTSYGYGDTVSLTATVVSIDGVTSVADREVTFRNGDTVLGTATTDENGIAEFTYDTTQKDIAPSETAGVTASVAYDGGTAEATATFALNKRQLDLLDVKIAEKTYDTTPVATVESARLEGTLPGDELALGEDFTVTAEFESAAASESATASYAAALQGSWGTYYEISEPTGTVSAPIAKAPLSVTADAAEVVFGAEPPVYTYQVRGLYDPDTIESVFGEDLPVASCSYAQGNAATTYEITVSGPEALENYDVTYTSALLTVKQSGTEVSSPTTDGESGEEGAFVYGDTITVTATIASTGVAVEEAATADEPAANALALSAPAATAQPGPGQAALWYRPSDGSEDVLLSNPVTVSDGDEVTLTYDTALRLLPALGPDTELTLVVKYEGTESMASAEATCTASLAAKPVELAWTGTDERTFDGTFSSVTAAPVEGSVLDVDKDLVAVSVSDGDAVSAGAYTASASLENTGADDVVSYYTLTNPEAAYAISAALLDESFFSYAEPFTYNGTEQMPLPNLTDEAPDYLTEADWRVSSYEDNLHAGTATVTLEGLGNFQGSAQLTFEIAPAEFVLSIPDQSLTEGDGLDALELPETAEGILLPDGSTEQVSGSLAWYLDEQMTEPVPSGWSFSPGTQTLYWSFTPSAEQADYTSDALVGALTVSVAALPEPDVPGDAEQEAPQEQVPPQEAVDAIPATSDASAGLAGAFGCLTLAGGLAVAGALRLRARES